MSLPPSPSPGNELGPGYERWRAASAAQRPPMRAAKPRYWLHILLFVLTIGTTTIAYGTVILPNGWFVSNISGGLEYSFWLLLILGCHEFGHYFAAKRHRVKATLPYFIPLPLPPLGTMGAVIRMSPYIPNRRALFDIAAAGPLAGIIVAIPVTVVAMTSATHAPVQPGASRVFGDPLLLRLLEWAMLGPRPEGYDVSLGPMGFAGWVGMFVTAFNLLPFSQLDGGHISHAVFAAKSKYLAYATFAGLLVVMAFNGWQYILIALLVWFVGLGHPPTLDDRIEIGPVRRALAVVLLLVFFLCFTPRPIVSMPF